MKPNSEERREKLTIRDHGDDVLTNKCLLKKQVFSAQQTTKFFSMLVTAIGLKRHGSLKISRTLERFPQTSTPQKKKVGGTF